jgi:hypothetical protein
VTFEEEGIELKVESFSMNATGEVIANLNALEANARASGDSTGVVNVKTVDGTETVKIDRAFQVRMSVTYDLPESAAAELTEEAAEHAGKAQE